MASLVSLFLLCKKHISSNWNWVEISKKKKVKSKKAIVFANLVPLNTYVAASIQPWWLDGPGRQLSHSVDRCV